MFAKHRAREQGSMGGGEKKGVGGWCRGRGMAVVVVVVMRGRGLLLVEPHHEGGDALNLLFQRGHANKGKIKDKRSKPGPRPAVGGRLLPAQSFGTPKILQQLLPS